MIKNKNYVDGIFAVPFMHIDVDDWENKKSKILSLKNSNLIEEEHENLITDYYECLNNSYANEIEKILEKEIEDIGYFFNLDNHRISEAWMEISNRDMAHYIHTHGPYGVSAVCFVEYDESVHKPTAFLSQHLDHLTGLHLNYIPPHVTEGSLIAFPSNINHFTFQNQSDTPRTILSFNLSHRQNIV